MSDLIHFGLFACYLLVLCSVAGNVRVKKMRNVSTLIQLTVLLLCLDLLIGFFAIEQVFDSSQSASWMMKGIYSAPVLFTLSLLWMRRAHQRSGQADAGKSD